MSKRKRDYSDDYSDIVPHGKKLTPSSLLPKDIWIYIGEFLTRKDFPNAHLNRFFAFIVLEWAKNSYKKEFFIFEFKTDEKKSITYNFVTFRSTANFYRENYYNLIDKAYIPLFYSIQHGNIRAAQKFIESKLACRLSQEENLVDMVFYQKNAHGETVISLARNLNSQHFLDFCFNQLILGKSLKNQYKKYRVVIADDYQKILDQLKNSSMSIAALWMYACAYVCNQTKICREMAEQKFWQITWNPVMEVNLDDDEGYSDQYTKEEFIPFPMLSIAVLLSSLSLAKDVIALIGDDENIHDYQFLTEIGANIDMQALYYNSFWIAYNTALDLAPMNKNINIINYLLEHSKSQDLNISDLAAFAVEKRDMTLLKKVNRDALFANIHISLKFLGINAILTERSRGYTPLEIAVIKNWLEGVKFIWSNRQADDNLCPQTPLMLALKFERGEITQFLLQNGANLAHEMKIEKEENSKEEFHEKTSSSLKYYENPRGFMFNSISTPGATSDSDDDEPTNQALTVPSNSLNIPF